MPKNKLWIQNQVAKGRVFDIGRVYDKMTKKIIKKTATKKKQPVKKENPHKEKFEKKKKTTTKKQQHQENEREYQANFEFSDEDPDKENYIKRKRDLELKKQEQAVELDRLKIQKIKGQLIPYDAVQNVFLYTVETFRNTYKQEVDALANVFIKRLGGGHEEFVELQKTLTEKVDAIQSQAKEDLLQGLKGIQAEYKEVRGRGERQ
jgi:predicted N-acyltransferase